MKVVIQSSAKVMGGNEKWLLLVAEGLAERGHTIVLSCVRRSPVEQHARAAGLRVTNERIGGDGDFYRLTRFYRMLRREKPDVLLLSAFKRSLHAGWAARRAGVRVVERMGIERTLPPKWKYRYAFRHYIDAMIVNSTTIRERWLESAPWYPADAVHVVLNAVHAPVSKSTEFRREIGVPDSASIIAAAGRLEPRKGFDVLLPAFAALRDDGAHLVIAGEGGDLARLQGLSRDLGIAQRVHFVGFRTDFERILSAADVFALSSRNEGMANVMLEAMAAGCMVVATDVSGVREAIGAWDGRNSAGWIVPVDDADAMANALRSALEHQRAGSDEAHRIQDELRYRVQNWFSFDRMIDHTERILAAVARMT